MCYEFTPDFPPPTRWRSLPLLIAGYYFLILIHETPAAQFEFIVKTMPMTCAAHPCDDVVTNTIARGDRVRLIDFSPELMPDNWQRAFEFAREWAESVVRYLDHGVRFYLRRGGDEFAAPVDGGDD